MVLATVPRSRQLTLALVSGISLAILGAFTFACSSRVPLGYRQTLPLFPWPPPAASATEVVPRQLIERGIRIQKFTDIDERLNSALQKNGYFEKSYFAVPGGFALVTRLEQIERDGSTKGLPQRWSVGPQRLTIRPYIGATSRTLFSLRDYMTALFTADPGHYRLIVFIVTDTPFDQSDATVLSQPEADRWLTRGLNVLPAVVGKQPCSRDVACTALIYEFERQRGQKVTSLVPKGIDAHTHMVKSGIWSTLEGGG